MRAAAVPIDTRGLFFPSDGLASLDVATGLSYPAKPSAQSQVGLLIERGPEGPVVSIDGMTAVRDAALQANVGRYLSEATHTLPHVLVARPRRRCGTERVS